MRINTSNKLSRRIFTYYVLFCLMSLVSLGCGVAVVSVRSAETAFENTSLSLISKAETSFTIAAIIEGHEGLQPLAVKLRSEQQLEYCAVVSPDGRYLAHSSSDQPGKIHHAPSGSHKSIGNVEKISTPVENGSNSVEFSVQLRNRGEFLGTLLLARSQPTGWQNLQSISTELPLALIGPALFLLIGGAYIRRAVVPVAEVHQHLSRFAAKPSIHATSFSHVKSRDSMSIGWNALVDELQEHLGADDFERHLDSIINSRQMDQCTAFDSLPDGIAETDIEGQITFINNAMAALLGADEKQDLFGQSIDTFLKEAGENGNAKSVLDKAKYSRASVAEISRATPAGERVLRVARNPIATGNSQTGQIWSVRDITQQKLAEKARDEFLNSATHELRTPLANIKAYAETLAVSDMLEVEQQKEFCNIINSEATRLARFIDELLDVSSIEAGSLQVKRQKVEVRRMLQEVVGKVRPLMEQKNIRFETSFAEKLPELPLDKDKFSICLVNLLGNAAKYTPENGEVNFRAMTTGNQLIVEVQDTGIGIAEEEIPRVFEKFFRCSDERVREQTGTGLGLAFAHEVARLHNATLTVQSVLDQGSTFTLTLALPREKTHV